MVELIVAILVMTIGLLGLASTAGVVTKLMSGARRQTVASNVVQARFEVMRNRLCTSLTSGSEATRNVRERWTVSFPKPTMALVVDSVSYVTMSGHPRTVRAYRSYVPCR